jgi:hypothetical protein
MIEYNEMKANTSDMKYITSLSPYNIVNNFVMKSF